MKLYVDLDPYIYILVLNKFIKPPVIKTYKLIKLSKSYLKLKIIIKYCYLLYNFINIIICVTNQDTFILKIFVLLSYMEFCNILYYFILVH